MALEELNQKMDALVQDLSLALEETSSGRRHRNLGRRRARSTGNLPLACMGDQSDQSSSSLEETFRSRDKGMSSLHQSDSDDGSPTPQPGCKNRLPLPTLVLKTRRSLGGPSRHGNCIESDSVNENFSPIRPTTRRKRKFKRMAVDPCELGSAGPTLRPPPPPVPSWLPSYSRHHHSGHSSSLDPASACGKRKRGARERSATTAEPIDVSQSKTSRLLAFHKLSLNSSTDCSSSMECGPDSSANSDHDSSLSSSESDPGIYTNDEGREGDDEQSDWVGDCSGTGTTGESWWETEGVAGGSGTSSLLQETAMSEDEQSYTGRLHWLGSSVSGREIRAGRRRLEKGRPGFSISTSANEKLSRFLQDPGQNQLRLHPMRSGEREQLHQLARLYSLNVHQGHNGPDCRCPVLTKTRHTMRVAPGGQHHINRVSHSLSDHKRRRRCPPLLNLPSTSRHSNPEPSCISPATETSETKSCKCEWVSLAKGDGCVTNDPPCQLWRERPTRIYNLQE